MSTKVIVDAFPGAQRTPEPELVADYAYMYQNHGFGFGACVIMSL